MVKMDAPDVTTIVMQRLGAMYVAHKAAKTRANLFGGYAVPPLTFTPEPGEDGAFGELVHVGYLHRLAHGYALTPASEWTLLRALVPPPPTRSERAVIELVAEYDLEKKVVDATQKKSASKADEA